MTDVELTDVARFYGVKRAIEGVSLHVPSGEFVSLLGPSGCGKTTTLALIAGLDKPTRGTIRIGDEVVARGEAGTSVLPEYRDLGLVPQSYALWPHMTVGGNVSFPLELRRVDRKQRERRVGEALDLVEMGEYRDRYPHELSGGQQQRVAIARTLVYKPKVLLLDEPLSNLDAKLRDRARVWLRRLQRELGVTTIFVTHDQVEALSLSDRIAVLENGLLQQVGSPAEVYNHPISPFVADFIGGCSFLGGSIVRVEGERGTILLDGTTAPLALPSLPPASAAGQPVTIAVRPEWLTLVEPSATGSIEVTVMGNEFAGRAFTIFASVAGRVLRFEAPTALVGTASLRIDFDKVLVFAGAPGSTEDN